MNAAVELRGVTKRFGGQAAVDDLDLTVPAGSIYGFIGPNGSGKTTTLRMILRIFQPDEGVVSVLGKEQGKAADDRVGYLPEERGLYGRMKVFELLQYYAHLKGFFDCKDEIRSWLERLGAESWENKRIDTLSKGMSQKVQFISSVVARPQLLILDEPFSGLDPVNMEALKEAILSMRESGTTIIFSTHDMDVAERMCDTVFMIFRGKKVLDGTLEDIKANYASDHLRTRLEGGAELEAVDGVTEVGRRGGLVEWKIAPGVEPSRVLAQMVQQGAVEHFEVVRPSLHDIFVDIADVE